MKTKTIAVLMVSVSLAFFSCNSSQTLSVARDFSAALSFSVRADEAVVARMKKFQGGNAASAPFFNAEMVKSELLENPGCSVLSMKQDGGNAISGTALFRDIRTAFPGKPGVEQAFSVVQNGDAVTLSIRIDRKNAKTAIAFFPGIDPVVVQALAPPALDGQALTEAEYSEMLKSVLGSKILPALNSAEYLLTISAPGPILAQAGGTVKGNSVTFKLPVMKALVLEKPVEFSLTWSLK